VYADKPMLTISLNRSEIDPLANALSTLAEASRTQTFYDCLPDRLCTSTLDESHTQQGTCCTLNRAGTESSGPASLCQDHCKLNAFLVRDVLHDVCSEVDEKLEKLIQSIGGRSHISNKLMHRVIDEAEAFLAATLDADEWTHFYKRPLHHCGLSVSIFIHAACLAEYHKHLLYSQLYAASC